MFTHRIVQRSAPLAEVQEDKKPKSFTLQLHAGYSPVEQIIAHHSYMSIYVVGVVSVQAL